MATRDDLVVRALELHEAVGDEITKHAQDWPLIARLSRELAELADRLAEA
jgi:hypothetical protein